MVSVDCVGLSSECVLRSHAQSMVISTCYWFCLGKLKLIRVIWELNDA